MEQGARAQLSSSEDGLCGRCRVVRAAGAPGAASAAPSKAHS